MMNKADQEILEILRETFRSKKKDELIDPDDLMAEAIIKWTFGISLLGILAWLFFILLGEEAPTGIRQIVATPIGIFFGLLFLHMNNKAENPSAIMFALTWVSMMFGLYF